MLLRAPAEEAVAVAAKAVEAAEKQASGAIAVGGAQAQLGTLLRQLQATLRHDWGEGAAGVVAVVAAL